jgi:hypothetical protein
MLESVMIAEAAGLVSQQNNYVPLDFLLLSVKDEEEKK